MSPPTASWTPSRWSPARPARAAWSAVRSPTSRARAWTTWTRPTVASIHARKTGALLLASLLAGARLCGATPAQERALHIYGTQIGLAFQITDDILDLEGDADKLGKPLGSDLKQDKATYPKVLGIPASRALARRACDAALAALDGFDDHADPLRALAHYIVERDS